ncbi:MAG: tetraacyldisaccharide 4'-kinase [Bacteroidota bacterium]
MNIIRFILLPFSVLYGLITYLRNKFYDFGWFKSTEFDLPVVAVGNLSAGGTGKTPHIEYLIRLLNDKYHLATLSRGYGRKTKGYFIADKFTNASDIGDEPMQFHQKFESVSVAVDANRVEGITKLMDENEKPEVILLDDAFQHRRVKPGLQILLTPYNDLFSDDWMLPTGRLREYSNGSKRADVVVVTKCPDKVSNKKVVELHKKLNIGSHQELFFSKIVYSDVAFGWDKVFEYDTLIKYKVLLVTGIANPDPLIKHLKSYDIIFKHLKFADHHDFTKTDVFEIESEFTNLGSGKKVILTTEKDYVRLNATGIHKSNLMYLPISVDFLNGDKANFDKKIRAYVKKN